MKPIVYIVSAPSGSGKSTLVAELLKLVPNLDFSVSYTTRLPRGSERNDKEYHFVARSRFEEMIRQDQFLEYADVFGNYYGTARGILDDAERKQHDVLLDIDVQGAAQIKARLPAAVSIFILPPDREKLEWRLRTRGLDAEQVIEKRLVTASREIENYRKYDYILVNDRLEQSVEALQSIVLAERLRRHGDQPSASTAKLLAIADQYKLSNVRERVQPILASFVRSVAKGEP
jgi:guanylate kinase